MATFNPPLAYPVGNSKAPPDSTTYTAYNWAINSSGDQVMGCWQATSTDAITHCGYNFNTDASPPTMKISIQGRSGTTGGPDGTIKGGGSPASATFNTDGNVSFNTYWVTLDNSYTPTVGELLK